jgi:N-hydroxyarylamine O-acetyltransferase
VAVLPPSPDVEPFDLPAYLERVGWTGPLEPNLATLAGIQLGHVARIPFENLDVQMGLPVRLDLESLQDKLVRRRRGGYCFEKNSLLAAALRHLGFQVALREARVRRGATRILPRTHLALQVDLPEGSFLVDGGFGADGPLGPVPFSGREIVHFGEACRVAAEGTRQVLQARQEDGWTDLYALELGSPHPIDLDMANHYTSTHPDSRFVQTLTAQRRTPEGQWTLRNLELTTRDARGVRTEPVAEADLIPLLRSRFELDLPEGARFRFQRG